MVNGHFAIFNATLSESTKNEIDLLNVSLEFSSHG
jgi:hypothetical protein